MLRSARAAAVGARNARRPERSLASFPLDDGAGQWAVDRPFDVGGASSLLGARLDLSETKLDHWEIQTHALLVTLVGSSKLKVDELRSGIERLDPLRYSGWTYYDKWAASIATAALSRGYASEDELNAALGDTSVGEEPKFKEGDIVRVKNDDSRLCGWRKPHIRVPGYIFGAIGVVERFRGTFGDPEFLAFRGTAAEQPLFTVRFSHAALGWGDDDAIVSADIYQGWLQPATPEELLNVPEQNLCHHHQETSTHNEPHDDHEHVSRYETELLAATAQSPETPGERLATALVEVLSRNGHLDLSQLRLAVEAVERLANPQTPESIGPRLVARAWKEPDFKQRLLDDAQAALLAEFGFDACNSTAPTKLVAVADQPGLKHIVVCTLCSCYPMSVLGISPAWYKDVRFRARAVREPRRLLAQDFGLEIPEETQIKVCDSTADCRYIVIPQPPPNVDSLNEADLAALVTRDCMIGVGDVRAEPSLCAGIPT